MDFSIVVPAYNEADKIAADVSAAAVFMVDQFGGGEVVVVDDGSRDGTAEAAEAVELPRQVSRLVIRNQRNRGKGHAVRIGMVATRGDLALFADSGLCVPFANALRGVELIRGGDCELAHGSRRHPQTEVRRPPSLQRRLISSVFRGLVPRLMGVPESLADTQCGFKLYKGDTARELYAACVCDGFMFDVEVILRAVRRGCRIAEFQVEWHSDRDSRVSSVGASLGSLAELLLIRRTLAHERRRRSR